MIQHINSPHIHNDWTQPLPLQEGATLCPWPKQVFPEPFETFVNELSRSTETPIELAAMITLSAIATAAQQKYQVQVKSDYAEPVNIWSLPILPPASRKSRVYSEVTAPLREWEFEQKKINEPLIQIAISKHKTMEARLKNLRANAAKAENEIDFNKLQADILQLEQSMVDIPTYPQIWTGDVTPEHLGNIMASNNEAMAVLNDEGGIFDILSGLYSDGKANIDLFLQSHSASPVRVDRGSRPPILMNRPVLTMGLTVQPQIIKTICSNKTFRGRGLLGRFLYVIPKSNIGQRTLEEPSMEHAIALAYRSSIRAIIHHPPSNDAKSTHNLSLSIEAYSKWLEYAKCVEMLMGEELAVLSHITDWAGKLPGAIARIAALIHIMRYAHSSPWQYSISLEDMTGAVKIGHTLSSHARAVFELIETETSPSIALAIMNWVKSERIEQFSFRDCQRRLRRFKKNDLRSGINILKEHDFLKEWMLKPESGRPSDIFDVNPHVFEASLEESMENEQ